MEAAMLFAVFLATAYAAHNVADHVLGQSDDDAANKAKPGRVGWNAITSHVLKYHLVMMIMLLVTTMVLNVPATFLGVFASLLFSVVTHAILDRRWPVRWILEKTASPKFAEMTQPLCGMYLADQGLHYFCLWISALLFAVL
jgi:hypothetical protein